jgi:hypothetical protein
MVVSMSVVERGRLGRRGTYGRKILRLRGLKKTPFPFFYSILFYSVVTFSRKLVRERDLALRA